MTRFAWKLNDKEWVKKRRDHWKRIEGQLNQLAFFDQIRKEDIRYHKAYFLKGECLPYDEKWHAGRRWINRSLIGQPYELDAMYRIWYHPEVDEAYFAEVGDSSSLDERLGVFMLVECNYCVDARYEFFEDRSYYIDRYLVPKTCADVFDLHPPSNRTPQNVLDRLLRSIIICLRAKKSTHSRGIYLLAFAAELFVDALNRVDLSDAYRDGVPSYADRLYKAMQISLYEEPEGMYMEHGLPNRLRDVLIELFNSGINQTVDALWAKAKASKSV